MSESKQEKEAATPLVQDQRTYEQASQNNQQKSEVIQQVKQILVNQKKD